MTDHVHCFMLEPTNRARVFMRRYRSSFKKDTNSTCSFVGNDGYHHAKNHRGDEEIVWDDEKQVWDSSKLQEAPPHDDPLWPRWCACGYVFEEDDEYQRFFDILYRRVDTGEEMTLRDAPSGAMYYAPWHDHFCTPQGDAHTLVVKCPGGRDWIIDSQSSNCGQPDDMKQEHHHCWIRHGIPPNITVDKDGVSCQAGGGSIQIGNYHGFLRNGVFEP